MWLHLIGITFLMSTLEQICEHRVQDNSQVFPVVAVFIEIQHIVQM